ncbi:amidohydrolase family protein [Alcaligenes faecalis]|uniref:amidohydrolase family protein n=1 Tax=Alcaligenes faecalis TaxID=511 RepID=UPI001C9B28F3|nr:amidohydrolase [Alcaligenes faecalis]MBY6309714.1 amidohydrolase [Alcaligenes faecalis]MBY6318511.1 amidohydrolase [Alcaligenes faecalis]MBY6392593.1 amidohydrolase [Alcaligenes faecalis]
MTSQLCDIVIHAGKVVTMNDQNEVLENGVVAISGNRICAVGQAQDMQHWQGKKTIHAPMQALIPGLIDTHNHLFQLAGRGLGDGMALWQWLGEYMLPLAADIRPQEALAAVRLGALEAASSGVTTVLDNHYAPADPETTIAVAQALQDTGLRGVVARGMFGPFTPVARDNGLQDTLFRHSVKHELDTMQECLSNWQQDRVQIWPSPINIIYNDLDLVLGSAEMARKFDVRWQTHCSEAPVDPDIFQKAYGARPFRWLDEQGWLDERAGFAHAIWMDDDEIARAGRAGCSIAHNPMSNEYLASGPIRLKELLEAGVRIGLGADGAAGHQVDLFQIMRQAVYVQRLARLDPQASNAQDAFWLATRGGAEMLGIDAGQLSEGKLADMALVNLDQPHLSPCFDVVASLVYCASGRDVTTTIVNGQVIYENGESQCVSKQEVVAKAREHCTALITRLGVLKPACLMLA